MEGTSDADPVSLKYLCNLWRKPLQKDTLLE